MNATSARRRATAMPATQRRALLIEATIPLLLDHGSDLTTRQIAEAAGVAEGTIFRVFPDKESLLSAVVDVALDPTQFEVALAGIDRALPLEERLIVAVGLLQRRIARIGALMTATGISKVPAADGRSAAGSSIDALARLFEPDGHLLRRPPRECARALRGLAIASAHPALGMGREDAPHDIVSLLLHGVMATAETTETTETTEEGPVC